MKTGSTLFDSQHAVQERFTQGGGVNGEIGDLRRDVKAVLNQIAPIGVFEADVAPVNATTNAILLAKACTTSVQTYTAAQLDGAVGDDALAPARNVTVTTAGNTPADAPATLTVTGLDVNGVEMTEAISVPQTAASAAGAKCFSKITGLSLTAGQGTDATVAVGLGVIFGLYQKPKTRTAGVYPILERVAGTVPTAGALATTSTGNPFGTYTPHSSVAPNGTRVYVMYYEIDPVLSIPRPPEVRQVHRLLHTLGRPNARGCFFSSFFYSDWLDLVLRSGLEEGIGRATQVIDLPIRWPPFGLYQGEHEVDVLLPVLPWCVLHVRVELSWVPSKYQIVD